MPPDLTRTRTAILNAVLQLGVNATLSAVAAQVGVTSCTLGIFREVTRRPASRMLAFLLCLVTFLDGLDIFLPGSHLS